jgi:hypothetical protein
MDGMLPPPTAYVAEMQLKAAKAGQSGHGRAAQRQYVTAETSKVRL